jgi:hypothetical protein
MRTQPKSIFGVSAITFFEHSNGAPFAKQLGTTRVLEGSNFATNVSKVEQKGGVAKSPWDTQITEEASELSFTLAEFAPFLAPLFGGAIIEYNPAEANGYVGELVNKVGTSIVSASAGVASIGLKASEGEKLAGGLYILEAIAGDKLAVYYSNDAFLKEGQSFIDDSLRIIEELTITDGGTVDVANGSISYGLQIVGGAGVSFTIGDTAAFEVREPNSGSSKARFGSVKAKRPYFSALLYSENKDGSYSAIEVPRLKSSSGFPLNFTVKDYMKTELKADALYDSSVDGTHVLKSVESV